ncbi:MAG: RDD family protein [Acidobacteriota bacterium]
MTSSQKLIIETPELIPLEFTLAGVGSRFLALALDWLIQAGLTVLIVIPFVVMIGVSGGLTSGSPWALAVLGLLFFGIQYGYFAGFEAAWSGQTPGKRRLGLRVIKDTGLRIGVLDALVRNLVRIIDALPGIYAIGIVSVLASRQSKRLGDYVAGTVVVLEVPVQEGRLSMPAAGDDGPGLIGQHQVARLGPAELELVERFLQRRDQLDADVRRAMAARIAERVRRAIDSSPPSQDQPEEWLEQVARAARRLAQYR